MGEHRRRQRIDAASRMLNHLMSLVMWIVITIVGFHLLDIDAAFFLSSAGFLGAAVAIGGQHKVNDYLTGLTVHFEDRYGVGDEIVVGRRLERAGPRRRRPHRAVQHALSATRRARCTSRTTPCRSSATSRRRRRRRRCGCRSTAARVPRRSPTPIRGLAGSSELTDVIFLGDIAAYEPHTGQVAVDVRTLRPLDDREAQLLTERAQRVLVDGPASALIRRADQTAVARMAAARLRRMTRRSSSESPPQMPESWLVASAKSKQAPDDRALTAYPLGMLDLHQRHPGGAHGEEQIRIGVPAKGLVTPLIVGSCQGEAGSKDRHGGAPRRLVGGRAGGARRRRGQIMRRSGRSQEFQMKPRGPSEKVMDRVGMLRCADVGTVMREIRCRRCRVSGDDRNHRPSRRIACCAREHGRGVRAGRGDGRRRHRARCAPYPRRPPRRASRCPHR